MRNPFNKRNPEDDLAALLDNIRQQLPVDDPFEDALDYMHDMNAKKRADYASDTYWLSNFKDAADGMGIEGFGITEAIEFNVRQKLARLTSLRKNGRMNDTQNETVDDTYLDLSVYATILYAHVLEKQQDKS